MLTKWENAYSQLEDFIKNNPQIRIKKHITAIPADIRPEFYRLFDIVRGKFLEEKCQTLLDEASPLSRNYTTEAAEAKKNAGLSEIKLPLELNWFLNDPIDGLKRSFYSSLFDLLKSEIDIKTFESEALQSTANSFKYLFKAGYEKWITLSLINLLKPDKTLALPYEEIQMLCHEPEADDRFGFLDKKLPDIEETKSLSFHPGEDVFRIANLVAHSAKLNRYFSIGADISDATWSSAETSIKREWIKIRELGKLLEPRDNWPDLVIFIDDKPESIALVADFGRFCRPDIIVECMEKDDWYGEEGVNKVKQNHDFFKPKLGSYVVSRLPVPEEIIKDLSSKETINELGQKEGVPPDEYSKKQLSDINVLTVGYDRSSLAPIVDILSTNKD
jgi:hypothetical protein